MEMIPELDSSQELKVYFFPELYLQRRIWTLNILRKEGITRVLDVGCGEGELLGVLSQPAPWLPPPPPTVLPPVEPTTPDAPIPPTPIYNDEIPNLHIKEIHGLDISSNDLEFAVKAVAPPREEPDAIDSPGIRSYHRGVQRWEELVAKVWKGGLEVINEEFVDMECIVSTEVIEHLPPEIFQAYAPMLLGVYHPQYFLVTTPSYTFNARFTSPDAPKTARNGFPDPTGRTDRVFRHSDHKFEWTREEFETWCDETAAEWGYDVERTTIGRATDADPWGRDDVLGGASSVAVFRRRVDTDNSVREEKGRRIIRELSLSGEPHQPLAVYQHGANPASMKPKSLAEIAACVKAKMEEFREAFMRVEDVWFESEIACMCGGWIELLLRAAEESPDLNLKRDVDGVVKTHSNMWSIELIGGVADPSHLWPAEGDTSTEFIPPDWTPGEGPYEGWEESDADGSTGIEGDVSSGPSDEEMEEDLGKGGGNWPAWKASVQDADEEVKSNWDVQGVWGAATVESSWSLPSDIPHSARTSTAGWDGDESDDTTS